MMPKLAHMNQPEPREDMFSQVFNNIFDVMAQSVVKRVEPALAKNDQNVSMVVPLIQNAIRQAGAELVPQLAQISARMEQGFSGLAQLHQKTIEAMGRIQIPDYSDSLARLEGKDVDLSDISGQLQALGMQIEQMQDERPREWRFEIQRDQNGVIKSVEAYADEDD